MCNYLPCRIIIVQYLQLKDNTCNTNTYTANFCRCATTHNKGFFFCLLHCDYVEYTCTMKHMSVIAQQHLYFHLIFYSANIFTITFCFVQLNLVNFDRTTTILVLTFRMAMKDIIRSDFGCEVNWWWSYGIAPLAIGISDSDKKMNGFGYLEMMIGGAQIM